MISLKALGNTIELTTGTVMENHISLLHMLSMVGDCRPKVLDVTSLQPLTFLHKLDTFLLELEFLYFPACGFRVVVDPEDVLGY